MKTFKTTCAQGDIYIRRMPEGYAIPPTAMRVEPEKDGRVIVTRSETLHHHVIMGNSATLYRLPDSIMDCLLVVDKPTALEHLRQHDTHEPIMFEPGVYHVRRQREYTPEGFRRVED
jgi:hypothetical protein